MFVALLLLAAPPQLGVDRIDLIAEAPGTFVNFDVPNALVAPTPGAVRFVEQVQLVMTLPIEGLYVGASLSAQTLSFETPLADGFFVTVGVQTRLLLPVGGYGGLAWRWRWMRVALGASAFADASWARLTWNRFTVVPTLGFGIVL